MRIYVASSWRNERQPAVVGLLTELGHAAYDFRNPCSGVGGFAWSDIDPAWKGWSPEAFRAALDHPLAQQGFALDMAALALCDACVLVLPSGRSAHLEAGYVVGRGKPTAVLLWPGEEALARAPQEPELMYRMCAVIADYGELRAWLANLEVAVRHDGIKRSGS